MVIGPTLKRCAKNSSERAWKPLVPDAAPVLVVPEDPATGLGLRELPAGVELATEMAFSS